MQVKDIAIKTIKIGQRFSTPDAAEIRARADSINEVGLLEPVGVNKDHSLIYGLTRIEAAKLLGWKKIPAQIFDVDEPTAKFMELCENLQRRELTVFARAEALEKSKELYQKMHPKQDGRSPQGKFYPTDNSRNFGAKIEKETGIKERNINLDIEAVKDIAPAARKIIPGTPIEDCRCELKRLGKLPEDEQKQVAKLIKKGEAETVKEAVETIHADDKEPGGDILAKMKDDNAAIESIARKITGIFSEVEALDNPHITETSVLEIFKSELKRAANTLRAQKGKGICPYCSGKWCKHCRKTGYLPQVEFDSAPKK